LGYRKQIGQKGEDAACTYLRKKGYKIVERNFRLRNAEVDIIAIDPSKKNRSTVFIEVKSRTSKNYGSPLEAIGYYKLQALNRAAIYYQSFHPELPQLLRLDAISIILNENGHISAFDHIENIG